ncbi:hypothetical protein BABINDRAFT_169466 [Babjeviella inositovora NRRL Y-12698]|uniref:DNA topoisomerase I n=1 Tax=Babjeviella inositovora NRRL Y-12698 TaxID=984486 RepID=A0A1E3QHD7_9ASCO|nr:uncharacterized protein BABINDRAFT_169466 [Babjeviella inositovora NRRL Y-12698]ODQ77123.1 hypothetical protein BABINDRAFT_169466 [Babjeviella inositovora NRRL Y-12698]
MNISDDEVPLNRSARAKSSVIKDEDSDMDMGDKPPSASSVSDDDYDEEAPIKKRAASVSPAARKKSKAILDDDDFDDVPLSQTTQALKPKVTKKEPKAKAPKKEPKDTLKKEPKDTLKKEPKAKAAPKVKKEVKEVKKEPKAKDDGTPAPEDNDTYKWWESNDLDGEIKWTTLEHSGVIFPPPYKALPKRVKLLYNGQPVTLPPAAEEVAGFFGALVETDHGKNPVFQQNFFKDFQEVLKEAGGCDIEITDFAKMDFSKMFAYFEEKREEKKTTTSAEKKKIKEEKDTLEAPYKTCLLDGRKEFVGNFRVEPPGLFRGRGAHPKTGKLKKRVQPEDIVLNLGKEAPVPKPPRGHKWGEIRHDNTVAWLAMWRENVLGGVKYVRFAANSSLKGISDFKKFEKARELKLHIEKVRVDYRQKLKSDLMLERQMAVCTYLIDVFALRAGGEKTDEEADTVGCCSLRFEHVSLKPPNTVVFDFLGKDSIRYYQEVEVDQQVFKNLRIFKKAPKKPGDDLFDRVDPSILNKHLQNYMPGLTAKVFRTYNATKVMQDQLNLIPNEGSVNEKLVAFNAANRTVAILCNHQRTIPKTHEAGVAKIQEKIQEMVWQKIRLKKLMLVKDLTLKQKRKGYFEEINDLTKEDERAVHKYVIAKEIEKVQKKFEKDNIKLKEAKQPLLSKEELKTKLDKIRELKKEYTKEASSGKPIDLHPNDTVEKLEARVEKLEERIKTTCLQLKDKEDNSQVALGTSKLNYIDPRLTVMFSRKFNVPIEKLFTKTLRDKFDWAIQSADEHWTF